MNRLQNIHLLILILLDCPCFRSSYLFLLLQRKRCCFPFFQSFVDFIYGMFFRILMVSFSCSTVFLICIPSFLFQSYLIPKRISSYNFHHKIWPRPYIPTWISSPYFTPVLLSFDMYERIRSLASEEVFESIFSEKL